eukprot:jgi/Undpi1/298/HiC_scaffold_1.g00294.m1
MAYLALYNTLKTGDFELYEAALRIISPLFLGYNKNLYHALCVQHLADITRLRPSEHAFISDVFSLSLNENVGKNVGLDEIQEMTMNKDIKISATGADVQYFTELGLTVHLTAGVSNRFKHAFAGSVVRKRQMFASARRTEAVANMVTELTADGNPFRLSDERGRQHEVSADGRVVLEHLRADNIRRLQNVASYVEDRSPGGVR